MSSSSGPFWYSGWEPRPLPEPWIVVAMDMRSALEAELRWEAADGHPLFGETVTAVARCQTCDDVVFGVNGDHPTWFAHVHLTRGRGREQLPLPATDLLQLPLAEGLRAYAH
jgi:hypothetical protein